MSHSSTNLLYHYVFGTKGREPWIDDAMRPGLISYLGGVPRKKGCIPVAVNAMPEHVHVFTRAHSSLAPATIAQFLKAGSSGWVHRTRPDLAHFHWQIGYGGFTVSQCMFDVVRQYVEHQQEHHRTTSYADELRRIARDEKLTPEEECFLCE